MQNKPNLVRLRRIPKMALTLVKAMTNNNELLPAYGGTNSSKTNPNKPKQTQFMVSLSNPPVVSLPNPFMVSKRTYPAKSRACRGEQRRRSASNHLAFTLCSCVLLLCPTQMPNSFPNNNLRKTAPSIRFNSSNLAHHSAIFREVFEHHSRVIREQFGIIGDKAGLIIYGARKTSASHVGTSQPL